MDTVRLNTLADFLEKLPPKRFKMDEWAARGDKSISPGELVGEKKCGTAACIAGWAVAVFDPQYEKGNIEYRARALLDLNDAQSTFLFYGRFRRPGQTLDEITPDQAVEALRAMAKS